nr:MAG TPA: Terminase [Bacteriophage sp.]
MNWSEADIEKARKHFWAFVYIVWKSIGLPNPTPIQVDIAQYLQNPPSDRVIIQGFRGVAKSFLTCAYAVWRLWHDRDLKVLIISASRDRADDNARFIKSIIRTLPFLADMKADKTQLDTQNIFNVGGAQADISPSVKSVGITGQITGTRADLLISDDVEVPKNSGTQLQRDKLSEAVKEYDAILKPGGQIIYLGTPQNEASLYNVLQKRGYSTRIWPVLYPENEAELESYGDSLAPFIADKYRSDPDKYKGTSTDPQRFDDIEIEKRRLSYGRAGFALQFLLNTNLSDFEKYPLKVSDLIIDSLDPHETSIKWSWANGPQQRLQDIPCVAMKGDMYYAPLSRSPETQPYTGTVMAIDPAGRGSDESAYAVMKALNGYLFLMEVGGFTEGYSDLTLTQMAQLAKFWEVNEIIVEANFGDGMFTKIMTPIFTKIHPCAITEVKHTKQKELRIIDTLEPILMRHKLIINQSVIESDYRRYESGQAYSLIYQMTRICRDKNAIAHDDRLDAVTMAAAYWLSVMDTDGDNKEEEGSRSFEDMVLEGVLTQPEEYGSKCVRNIKDLRY